MSIQSCFDWLWIHFGKNDRWRWIYRCSLWIYQHAKFYLRHESGPEVKAPVRLFYFKHNSNFGDRLNLDLMHHFHADFEPAAFARANVLCIGSILDETLIDSGRTLKFKTPVAILGTGFMMEQEYKSEHFNRPVEILALRGHLTKQRCEKILGHPVNCVLGDPGLLVKDFFPEIRKNPLYDVGIICHFRDKDAPFLKNIQLQNKTFRYIDIQFPTREFVRAVSECRCILSSALHGLICADSLNIANQWIVITDTVEGWGYKFRDYYSVFNQTPSPLKSKRPIRPRCRMKLT